MLSRHVCVLNLPPTIHWRAVLRRCTGFAGNHQSKNYRGYRNANADTSGYHSCWYLSLGIAGIHVSTGSVDYWQQLDACVFIVQHDYRTGIARTEFHKNRRTGRGLEILLIIIIQLKF